MQKGDFSAAELTQRIERVRALAREKGLDALVVYDTDGTLGGATVRYLSNFFNLFPGTLSVLVVPMSGEPVLLIPPGFANCHVAWAKHFSPLTNVKASRSGGYPAEWHKDIIEALVEVGFSQGNLGIDGMRFMSHATVEGLKRELPGIELADVSGLVQRSARVRSKEEEPFLRRAAQLSKIGMDAFLAAVKPGVRQADAVAIGENAARMAGADQITLFMSAGSDPWVWGYLRDDLVFKEGDVVALELNARYHGYYGQVCRTMLVGDVSEEKRRIHDAARAAHDAMFAKVKPGVTCQELYRVGLSVAQDYGFDYSGVRFGHGLGMTIAEGFDIYETDTTPIPERAYMVIHPLLIQAETGACGIYGTQFLVTTNGPELLSDA